MGYLFLSYRSIEITFALKLATDLKQMGIRLWVDKLEIRPADDWVHAISKGLDGCTALIAILSPDYLKSDHCIRELHRADRLNRVVFPIFLHPIGDMELPIELERKQFLDFSDWKNTTVYHAQLIRLVDAILQRFGDAVKIAPDRADTKEITHPKEVIEEVSGASADDMTLATENNVLKGVLQQLRSGNWGESQTAARALNDYSKQLKGIYSNTIVQCLTDALTDTHWMVRCAVTEALINLEAKEAHRYIVPLLKDPHQMVRMTAVRGLALLGKKNDAKEVLPLLMDKNNLIREACIHTLGILGNPESIPALLPLLKDKEDTIRLSTIEALGRIGDSSVLETLLNLLKTGDAGERWMCVEALGNLRDAKAIANLRFYLEDMAHPIWEERRICDMTVEALEKIGTPEAKNIVVEWRKKHTQITTGVTL